MELTKGALSSSALLAEAGSIMKYKDDIMTAMGSDNDSNDGVVFNDQVKKALESLKSAHSLHTVCAALNDMEAKDETLTKAYDDLSKLQESISVFIKAYDSKAKVDGVESWMADLWTSKDLCPKAFGDEQLLHSTYLVGPLVILALLSLCYGALLEALANIQHLR